MSEFSQHILMGDSGGTGLSACLVDARQHFGANWGLASDQELISGSRPSLRYREVGLAVPGNFSDNGGSGDGVWCTARKTKNPKWDELKAAVR